MPETTREHAPLIALERVISNERRVFHVTSIASASRRVQDTHGQVNPQVTVDCRTGTNIGPGGPVCLAALRASPWNTEANCGYPASRTCSRGRPKIAFSTWTGTPFYQERVGGGP